MTRHRLPKSAAALVLAAALSLSLAARAAPAHAAPGMDDRAAGASCDRLAAFNDGRAPTPPVPQREIDAPAAISACEAAVESPDARPRHRFQLARALLKAGRMRAARAALDRAIADDYPAAFFVMGQLFHGGHGVETDPHRAHALYSEAYARGYTGAAVGLILLYEDPASPLHDPSAAAATRLLIGATDRPEAD